MFKVWETIEIGGVSTKEYARSLVEKGIFVSTNAEKVLTKLPLEKPRTVALARVTNVQLGLGTGLVRRGDVYVRATELGLQKCPAEVGPVLRDQLTRQPAKTVLLIGMEPITILANLVYLVGMHWPHFDKFCIFSLENTKELGRTLYAPDARPEAKWDVPHEWVFAKEIRPA